MNEEKEIVNLREAAIAAVMAANGSRANIVELLAKYQDADHDDDIVYGIIFELEIIMNVLDRMNIQDQQRNETTMKRLEKLMEQHQEKMLEAVSRQQIISRSQFRRLVSFHRERLLTRLVIICALGLLSIFAGLGVFYFYLLVLI